MECSTYGCKEKASCSIGFIHKEYYCKKCYIAVMNMKRVIAVMPMIVAMVVFTTLWGLVTSLFRNVVKSSR